MGKWFSKYGKSLHNHDFMAIRYVRKGKSHFPTNFSRDRKGDMNVEELEELRKSVVRKQWNSSFERWRFTTHPVRHVFFLNINISAPRLSYDGMGRVVPKHGWGRVCFVSYNGCHDGTARRQGRYNYAMSRSWRWSPNFTSGQQQYTPQKRIA